MHAVFVYGTLKRGYPNHEANMQDARFVGRCRSIDAFPLVIGGRWNSPYMIDEPGSGHRIAGELFQVPAGLLARLDELESVGLPKGYHRREIEIEYEKAKDQTRLVWAYLKRRATIEGIHSPPMAEYPLNAGYVPPTDPRRSAC